MKYRLIQIASGLNPHDAITYDIIQIDNIFKSKKASDFISDTAIHALHISENLSFIARDLIDYHPQIKDIIIIHLSTFFAQLEKISHWPGKKILVYHNITPEHFFMPWNLNIAGKQIRARMELFKMSSSFDLSFGVSQTNISELVRLGFQKVHRRNIIFPKIPIPKFSKKSSFKSLLFVGRIVPNKGIHHLIKSFYYFQKMHPDYHLNLAGKFHLDFQLYIESLLNLIGILGLEKKIHLHGQVSTEHLAKLYQEAALFTCLSEHEGFCVPLIEAMQFQIPIVAYTNQNSAIEETLGDSGVAVSYSVLDKPAKKSWNSNIYLNIAATWSAILQNDDWKKIIIQKQNDNLKKYMKADHDMELLNQIRKLI